MKIWFTCHFGINSWAALCSNFADFSLHYENLIVLKELRFTGILKYASVLIIPLSIIFSYKKVASGHSVFTKIEFVISKVVFMIVNCINLKYYNPSIVNLSNIFEEYFFRNGNRCTRHILQHLQHCHNVAIWLLDISDMFRWYVENEKVSLLFTRNAG